MMTEQRPRPAHYFEHIGTLVNMRGEFVTNYKTEAGVRQRNSGHANPIR